MLPAHPGLEGIAVKRCFRAAGQAGIKGGLDFGEYFLLQAVPTDQIPDIVTGIGIATRFPWSSTQYFMGSGGEMFIVPVAESFVSTLWQRLP